MRVKKVYDGYELYPQNNKDKQMIKDLWNKTHPTLPPIKKLAHTGRVVDWKPKIVILTKRFPFTILVYVGDSSIFKESKAFQKAHKNCMCLICG